MWVGLGYVWAFVFDEGVDDFFDGCVEGYGGYLFAVGVVDFGGCLVVVGVGDGEADDLACVVVED